MKIYERVIHRADDQYADMLRHQIMNPSDPFYGGVRHVMEDIVEYNEGCLIITSGVLLYMNPYSRYYQDDSIFDRMEAAFQFCFTNMNPDGTKHYIDCNFYTAAGTETQALGEAILLMDREQNTVLIERFRARMMDLMEKLAYGVMYAGFHTPNHRWIYSGALSIVYRLTGKQEYLDAIEGFLKEGIDCSEDGEYAERSAGIYNLVTNRGLIMMAEHLNRPEFYTYVIRNLNLMRHYIEPDGSLFTMNSTRQDYGQKAWADRYVDNYLLMSKIDNNPGFFEIAMKLYYQAISHGGRDLETSMAEFMALHPEFQDLDEPESASPYYVQESGYFKNSGIVRILNNDISLSLLRDSQNFFYGMFGSIECSMRIYCHFFNARNAIFTSIEKTDDGYRMHYEANGYYLLPLEEKPASSDWWWQKEHCERKRKEPAHLTIVLDAIPTENGIRFRLHTETCDRVPIRIEMALRPNCLITGEGFRCMAQAGMNLMPTSGTVVLENNKDRVLLGPVFGEHAKTTGRKGALAAGSGEMTLYLNAYCRKEDREFSIEKVAFDN
ncbi:MAG: hypothetical protein ACOX6P_07200 [Candidatus Merdivicinus sp.]|jgi:hypothetical protein